MSPCLRVFFFLCFLLQLSTGPASEPPRRPVARPVAIEFLDGTHRLAGLTGADPAELQPRSAARPVARTAVMPADRAPKKLLVQFGKDSVLVPTGEIRRLVVQPTERCVIRSDTSVASLYLGEGQSKRPEPLNWHLPATRIEGWEWAAPQKTYYRWRYIPGACWIWPKRTARPRENESVLFRQEFRLPTTTTLISAVLDFTADDQIESLFLNGVSVPISRESLLNRIERWDVTHLLQRGRNVLAVRVTNLATGEQLNSAGLCYRIVCESRAAAGATPPLPPATVLRFTNGDRVSGNLAGLTNKQWMVRAFGRTLEIDSDWIDLALLNYREPGAETPSRTGGSVAKLLPDSLKGLLSGDRPLRPAVTALARPTLAWDMNVRPPAAERGIQGRGGEWVEGRIENLQNNRILIKPRYGETVGTEIHRVALVQPNRPDLETQFLFRPADFPAIVRVRMTNNDLLTGAIESISPYSMNLTPQFGKPVRLDLDQVLRIDFRMNAAARARTQIARAWPSQMPLQVGTIGEADKAVGPAKDQTVQAIHRALLDLGLEMRWLDAYQMVEPGLLSPERFPVLINLDQNERYFHTVKKSGDGSEAVQRFVREGGTLLHLARGAPFWQGYVPERGSWKAIRPPQDLNAALMMDFVTPERRSPRATSFQAPPNMGQRMTFVLDRRSPWAEGLPDQVEIPMIADMRFRPVTDDRVTSAAQFVPIYRLVDSTGINYGVAMAAIRYAGNGRPHYGVYVSHLLYEAAYEGVPMIEYLLPTVIEMAVGAGNGVSIATMASQDSTASRRSARAPATKQ